MEWQAEQDKSSWGTAVAPTRLRHPGATRPKSAGVVGQPFAGLLRGAREWRV